MTSENKVVLPSDEECARIWCDRVAHWPYYTFVRDEGEWWVHMRRMDTETAYPKTAGRMICFDHPNETPTCLVTMRAGWQDESRDAVSGLILHEAVHVYQVYRDYIEERQPSVEFEAYTVQTIYLSLLRVIEEKTGWAL